MPVSQRAISAFRIIPSLLSNSDCASDNFVWAASSPWKAWSASFSRKSWISLCSDRILFLSIWESCTLSKSRFLLPLDYGFPKLENGSTSHLDFSTLEWVWGTRNTEWDRTYFALLRKQWWRQPSHFFCVVDFRRIHSGREIVKVRVETALSKANLSECVRCWLRWKTWAHNLSEVIVQPVGQSITLLAEWRWMDTSKDITTKERKTNEVQV